MLFYKYNHFQAKTPQNFINPIKKSPYLHKTPADLNPIP